MDTFDWLQIFGLLYLVAGLGMMLNPHPLKGALDELPHNKLATLGLSFISLAIGSVIVVTHQLWSTPEEIIITLVGWAALIKGFLYLSFPFHLEGFKNAVNTPTKLRFMGLFCLLIGGAGLAWVQGWI